MYAHQPFYLCYNHQLMPGPLSLGMVSSVMLISLFTYLHSSGKLNALISIFQTFVCMLPAHALLISVLIYICFYPSIVGDRLSWFCRMLPDVQDLV